MEWNNGTEQFENERPKPSPRINVHVELIREEYERLGVACNGTISGTVSAITDTGCQTTTCGTEILKALNIPETDLLKTRHGIIGITDNALDILGTFLANITFNKKCCKQMVYVTSKPMGLFLSERACVDLGIIDEDFPNVSRAGASKSKPSNDGCECVLRSKAPDMPDEIPYEPSEENIPKLKEWLINAFSASAFNKCTHQKLPEMTGKAMDIVFRENAIPHCVHTPIKVPVHWKEPVKSGIDQDVQLGIIEPVPQNTHVEWCARMVVTPKKDGSPRRTVDLQELGKATLRDTHYSQTPFSIVSTTPTDKLKTVLDAWNGYHSLPLSDDAKNAMNFITEWGRYRYQRAPMGYHASGDAYIRRFDDITHGIADVARCVDDSLLWDDTVEGSFRHTFEYLRHCSDNGIIFNAEKFVFAMEECEFAGFELTKDGYRPPKRKLDAIRKFPTPTNLTDVRSWFGLINQVAYAFRQARVMEPFRELLSTKNSKFYWDTTLDGIFEDSKAKIVELIQNGVKTFEKNRITCVSTDFSKKGIGFTLTQKYCNCPEPYSPVCGGGHWRLTLVGSRFTTDAESRYAPVEGEALAATYGLHQCKYFVMGSPNLILATDHKPLTRILNERPLESIENPRLLKFKEKTLMYDFKIIHVPGSSNQAPDALSRYPTKSTFNGEDVADDADIEECSKMFAVRQGSDLPASIDFEMVNEEATIDNECRALKNIVRNGFPEDRNKLPTELRYYWSMRDELYAIENVCFKGKKMLIPSSLRTRILEGLHAGHQGVSSMTANARERFFWPHLDSDIKQTRAQCRKCDENAPSQPAEPMIITPVPELPFEQVASDQCTIGSYTYLIYVDRYSGWVEVAKIKDQSFKQVKKSFLRWFATFGVPDEISSDGGPPYNSFEYCEFLKTWKIEMRKSSAYYPQSNGRAEAAVKTAKRLLLGNINTMTGEVETDAVSRALLTHRNTPSQLNKLSPSELLFGHTIKDHLPNKFRKLRKDWRNARRVEELSNCVKNLPGQSSARILKPLSVGDHVSIQNQAGNKPKKWSNTGHVVQVLPNRKYLIMTCGSKRLTTRNRKFLRKIPNDDNQVVDVPPPCPKIPQSIPETQSVPDNCTHESSSESDDVMPEQKKRVKKGPRLPCASTPKKPSYLQSRREESPMVVENVSTRRIDREEENVSTRRIDREVGSHESSVPPSQPKDPPPVAIEICTPEVEETVRKQYPLRNRMKGGIRT